MSVFCERVSLFVILLLIIHPIASAPLFLTFLRSAVDFDGLLLCVCVHEKRDQKDWFRGEYQKGISIYLCVARYSNNIHAVAHMHS